MGLCRERCRELEMSKKKERIKWEFESESGGKMRSLEVLGVGDLGGGGGTTTK